MKTPSRLMPLPKEPRQLGYFGISAFIVTIIIILAYIYFSTGSRYLVFGVVAAFALLFCNSGFSQKKKERERKEESICTFSKALPAREHDTWVVRAVYEEATRITNFPIRPSDRLGKDLGFHSDDLDDLAYEIARRAGRSMENSEVNLMFERVTTILDMVTFFEYQPKEPDRIGFSINAD